VAKRSTSHCPIHFALEAFGDAWTLLVVRDLMFKGKSSYGEFLESDEKISTNILADRLALLETHGIVTKTVIRSASARTRYELTEKGLALMPMLVEMIAWSATYDPKSAAPPAFVMRARKDRAGLMKELRQAHRSKARDV